MCSCLWCCTGFFLFRVPYCSLVGFLLTFVGFAAALSSRKAINGSFATLHISEAAQYMDYIWLIFFVTVVVNGIAAFQAFSVTAKMREQLFVYTANSVCWLCQLLLGVGMQVVVFLCLIGTFIAQLVFGYCIVPGVVVLFLVDITCREGPDAIATAVDLLNRVTQDSFLNHLTANLADQASAVVLDQVDELCREESVLTGIRSLAFGGLLCLLTQVYMLVVTYGNILKVCHSMEKKELLANGRNAGYNSA